MRLEIEYRLLLNPILMVDHRGHCRGGLHLLHVRVIEETGDIRVAIGSRVYLTCQSTLNMLLVDKGLLIV